MKKSFFTKIFFFTLFLIVSLFLNPLIRSANNNAYADIEGFDESVPTFDSKPIEDSIESPEATAVIAILLNPHIMTAVEKYFGEPTQYALYDAAIKKISQAGHNFAYKVTISVETFHGPHNPPYGIETMTFSVSPLGVVLNNYIHQDK